MQRSINGVIVEWDIDKNTANIQKHGLSFETASLVFSDINRVELYDYKHGSSEHRYKTIGLVNSLVAVVYADRKNVARIISARLATKTERKIYYEQNS